jgi:hypothetical protein
MVKKVPQRNFTFASRAALRDFFFFFFSFDLPKCASFQDIRG